MDSHRRLDNPVIVGRCFSGCRRTFNAEGAARVKRNSRRKVAALTQLVNYLERMARGIRNLSVPKFQPVKLGNHHKGYYHMVILKLEDALWIVNQDVGVEYKNLA